MRRQKIVYTTNIQQQQQQLYNEDGRFIEDISAPHVSDTSFEGRVSKAEVQ